MRLSKVYLSNIDLKVNNFCFITLAIQYQPNATKYNTSNNNNINIRQLLEKP